MGPREELCDILRDLTFFQETVDDIQATYHCSSRRCTPANLDRKILFPGRMTTGQSDFSGFSRLSAEVTPVGIGKVIEETRLEDADVALLDAPAPAEKVSETVNIDVPKDESDDDDVADPEPQQATT